MDYDVAIIGGAGPAAGALVFNKIIAWYQRNRGAWQDQDFPKITLISYPFSDMLGDGEEDDRVHSELHSVVEGLSAKYYLIACNTLHCYCQGELPEEGWIHLMKTTAEALGQVESPPLVLCTSTSRRHGIHKKYFDCVYPSQASQPKVDQIIEDVLRGQHNATTAAELATIAQAELVEGQKVVPGCTELSLLFDDYPAMTEQLADPCIYAVNKLCELLTREQKRGDAEKCL